MTRCIGAAHAGWRGTALGIAAKTIAAMERLYGAKAEHIRAAIGPGISRCCFETDTDVPAAMRAALGAEVEPYLQRSAQDGKWHVDLKAINRHWMLRAGLAPGTHRRERRVYRLLHRSVLVAPPHGRRARQPGRHDLFEGNTMTKEAAPL